MQFEWLEASHRFMDKKRKTKWEKQIRHLPMVLIILLPLLFGVVFGLVARLGRFGS
jgi:hypothetical protein